MKGNIPGFRFSARKKTAHFELVFPGSHSRKRKRATVQASTRDEALEKWKLWRDALLDGAAARDLTLAQYRDQAWPLAIKGLAPKTVQHETWILEQILLPRLGSLKLARINDANVGDLVADLRVLGYATPSINGIVAVLRKVLRDAVYRDLSDRVAVKRFPHEKEGVLRLEMSELERLRFLNAFEDEKGFLRLLAKSAKITNIVPSRFYRKPRRFGGGRRLDSDAAAYEFQRFAASKHLFVVALETGLAQGDLLRLVWSDVDLQSGWIRIRRAKTKVPAEIPISGACREALTACRSKAVVGEAVFLTEFGQPYSVTTANRYFRKAKAIAGITRRLRFHDMRHTFASRLASKGVSLQIIARALGHSSTAMAERYARPSDEAVRDTVTEALAEGQRRDGEISKNSQTVADANSSANSYVQGDPRRRT